MGEIIGHHKNIRIENNDVASDPIEQQHRAIPKGKTGSSAQRPITMGGVYLNPGADETIHVFLISKIPLHEGHSPNYTITYGNVYVLDGPNNSVDLIFPPQVSGNVNIQLVPKQPGVTA